MVLSIQEIAKRRQERLFIGRETFLSRFANNLSLQPDLKKFIINVYGESGMGKTWLGYQFKSIAEEAGYHTLNINGNEILDCFRLMDEISKKSNPRLFREYIEKYQNYKSQLHEAEVSCNIEENAPRGISKILSGFAKIGIRLTKTLRPDSAFTFINEDDASNAINSAILWLENKFGADSARLLQDPFSVLAPLFLKGVNASLFNQTVIFIDNFHELDNVFTGWFFEICNNGDKYGLLPSTLLFVLMGTDELDSVQWAEYDPLLMKFNLPSFSISETEEYVHRKIQPSTHNTIDIEYIHNLSQGKPLLLATLLSNISNNDNINDETKFIELYLKHFDEDKKRLFLSLCVPKFINNEILELIISPDSYNEISEWFYTLPFIQGTIGNNFEIHPLIRKIFLGYYKKRYSTLFYNSHKKLSIYFKSLLPEGMIESKSKTNQNLIVLKSDNKGDFIYYLYHALCSETNPSLCMEIAINPFIYLLDDKEIAMPIAKITIEASHEINQESLASLGEKMQKLIQCFEENNLDDCINSCNRFIDLQYVHPENKFKLMFLRVIFYIRTYRYHKAVSDARALVVFAPKNKGYKILEADTLFFQGDYFNAINKYNELIKASDEKSFYFYRSKLFIGKCLLKMNDYRSAIKIFEDLQSMFPKNPLALVEQGIANSECGNYELAIYQFDIAENLAPNLGIIYFERGKTYIMTRQYRLALSDLFESLSHNISNIEDVYALIAYIQMLDENWSEAELNLSLSFKADSCERSWKFYILYLLKNNSEIESIESAIMNHFAYDIETRVMVNICYALFGNNLYNLALKFISTIPHDNLTANIHNLKGKILFQQNKISEAIKEFEKSDQINSFDEVNKYDLGLAYMKSNRYEKASIVLSAAKKAFPYNIDLLLLLAECYVILNINDDADQILTFLRLDCLLTKEQCMSLALHFTYLKKFEIAIEIYENNELYESYEYCYNITVAYVKFFGLEASYSYILKSKEMLEQAIGEGYLMQANYGFAGLACLEGNKEKAISFLEKAMKVSENSIIKSWALLDTAFDDIRLMPKFKKLIET